MLYDPLYIDEACIVVMVHESWLGVLDLADKLDCPGVLKASAGRQFGLCMVALLPKMEL